MAEPIHRSASIEEFTNGLVFQPLSTLAAPILVKARVSANATSLLGMAAGVTGAWLYRDFAASHTAVLVGFALMCLWHVLDGADGQVARITGTQSPLGKLIDGLCDYVVFISAYVLITLQLAPSLPGIAWPLAITAGLFHALQAGAYEAQRQMFDYWALGKASARIGAKNGARPDGIGSALLGLYEWLQLQVTAITPAHLAGLERRIGTPARDNPQSRAYGDFFAPAVRRWGIMCANYRTYGIFIACLIGRPESYFLWEICVLGPVHLLLVAYQRRLNGRFLSAV